ncbi:hypothetical protein PF010_g464 [Phytophthora fragariae]|uniref:Myb/SANT-like domain-containing protein n=2 Tax=Phytophthora fragariae TaxID=53985 RepID=A0A6A4AJB1_9STRA|nr:hypothetical protein PF003_g9991 [Phytophthora fragariae]KAE9139771.1 hypothetical protein PF010_g464 [Phytophthora fragariae]KAE9257861.1 hypothetical protein PF002_g659 [Phytophthora fragariae]
MSGMLRAVWGLNEEQVLLELFEKARQDTTACTGRGVKTQTWANIVKELNERCKSSFVVEQIRSKYSRLMIDYDLFQEVGGEGSLSEEQWEKIIAEKSEHASRLRQFKESGCPHLELCRRIAESKGGATSTAPRAKRATSSENGAPKAKKACIEETHKTGGWNLYREKLLMFLCWRAKGEPGFFTDGWAEMTTRLNEYCTTNFTLKETNAKYVELMQHCNEFKAATGFSGDLASIPKSDMDWECLIRGRPQHYVKLEKYKEVGGFPHAEVCSLIKGDTPPNGMGPASISEYLSTGALQIPNPARNPVIPNQTQSSDHTIASAQASLSAKALSYLLPATANMMAAVVPPAANGSAAGSVPEVPPPAASAPAVMTQELHDNLNMFLKTATAYLVMLINDHNQDREL